MLVTDEQAKLETSTGEVIQKHDPDGPPPYEAPPRDSELSGPSFPTIYPAVPTDIQANNYLAISRSNDSIRGRYIIDTSLKIPESLLPELEEPSDRCGGNAKAKEEERLGAGERPNLRLANTNGSISADVWIVDGEKDGMDIQDETKRAFVEVKNTNGSVKIQLAADPSKTPFALLISTTNGSVALYIPRTYTGPLTIRKGNGSVKLSPEIEARLQTFSDIKGKRTCFIGDFRQSGYGQGEEEWLGNAIDVGSKNGSIRISFINEEETNPSVIAPVVSGPGFWSKLFGGSK